MVIVGRSYKAKQNEVIRKILKNEMMIEVKFSHANLHNNLVVCFELLFTAI